MKDSSIHLQDIGSRIKKYRNNKMDPLVSIAKRREREYLTGAVNSQTSLHGSPHFEVDSDTYNTNTLMTTDRFGNSASKRFSNISRLNGTLPTTYRGGSEMSHIKPPGMQTMSG